MTAGVGSAEPAASWRTGAPGELSSQGMCLAEARREVHGLGGRHTDLPCPLTLPVGSSLQPGQSWSDPRNPCVTHECEKHRDGLVVVTRKKACPPLSCPEVSSGSPQPSLAHCGPMGGRGRIRPGWGGEPRLALCSGRRGTTRLCGAPSPLSVPLLWACCSGPQGTLSLA